jgi:UDP-N-acetylmuramoyl-L-alanyl-D-glutamate--2,6-diaminopimelate ligase
MLTTARQRPDREQAVDVDEGRTLQLTVLMQDVAHEGTGGADPAVAGVAYRSDTVEAGDVFFCVPGFQHDGHDFAADAIARGAVALVVKRHLDDVGDIPQVLVADPREALARASARFHSFPSRRMDLVGITGTNGKTTTTYLVESVLAAAGLLAGLVGTVEIRVAGTSRPAGRTTPESADLQALLGEMVEAGVEAAVMEVSSHAIDLHRVDAVDFAVAAFTNLTQDHLDYHKSLEEYYAVKRRLFTEMTVASRVIDVEDEYGRGLAEEVGAEWTVGFADGARVRATDIELGPRSSEFNIEADGASVRARLPLAGRYNVENALVAAGCGLALGVGLGDIADGLERAPQVPGRLERIDAGQPFAVYVDYAHTPDALGKAIQAVKEVTTGRVVTVFGCGGDRDPEKRPLMGAAAGTQSDVSVVTTDNPRTEDPVGIVLHIEDGLKQAGGTYEVEIDRRRAIARAFELAESEDAVLIAGKGHEDYQVFADRTIHFDDREVAREELERLC